MEHLHSLAETHSILEIDEENQIFPQLCFFVLPDDRNRFSVCIWIRGTLIDSRMIVDVYLFIRILLFLLVVLLNI